MGSARRWTTWLCAVALAACGSSPPPPAPTPQPSVAEDDEPADASPPTAGADPVTLDSPEKSRPPSTATYEEAMSTPENLDVNDNRPHLNDDQLRGPMRNATTWCPLPKNAKVTIKTAVQSGRAIGVTVDVRFEHPPAPPSRKRPTVWQQRQAAAIAKQEAKAKKKIAACIDQKVRAIVWPPSSRRDSFTTDF